MPNPTAPATSVLAFVNNGTTSEKAMPKPIDSVMWTTSPITTFSDETSG